MKSILKLIGRETELFHEDVSRHDAELQKIIALSRFLVIGGAGSIGQAVAREIFKRSPQALHVIDLSENNLVELVRDIRSSLGYIEGDFQALPLDSRSAEYEAFVAHQKPYDYILNLSALKHVRSEKDPFSLMRLIDVNIFNTDKLAQQALRSGSSKYFCVSTDKATNPVNMMGASKRIMEMFLMRRSLEVPVSTARFANVAFSDGSLLHGFNLRMQKRQPLSAPHDVRRYFVTPKESGELCLMSCLLGKNRDIFFPKLSEKLHLITFSEIAVKFLEGIGFEAFPCATEDEARARVEELASRKKWPCYFFTSDTTGEKDFEEFYTGQEKLDMQRFTSIGVIKNDPIFNEGLLNEFKAGISSLQSKGSWTKEDLVGLFNMMLPEFHHKETGKYLDQKM
ncbi:MAG: NAD-dependent epimerase/dehydratase family protein [Desulfobacteraceae bacterium]|nr:MAG: NAD-dependent epimerase/dehydratase family protein [Desulfobacteraceae bacterium]